MVDPSPNRSSGPLHTPTGLAPLEQALRDLGIPADRCGLMASQLDRRAVQLAQRKGRPYDEALAHLVGLMRQGSTSDARNLEVPGVQPHSS